MSITKLLAIESLVRSYSSVSKYEGNLVVGRFNFLTKLIKDSSNMEKYVQCKMIMIFLPTYLIGTYLFLISKLYLDNVIHKKSSNSGHQTLKF